MPEPTVPITFKVNCWPALCHEFEITSDDLQGDAQDMYSTLWNAHDEHCRTVCKCSGELVVTFLYTKSEPYESRREFEWAEAEEESAHA